MAIKRPLSEFATRWTRFYSRLMQLLPLFEAANDDAGKLAREALLEIDGLWVCLDEAGVE